MAIIKLGVVVTGIRGTIGGMTFTNTLGGPTAKMWSKPGGAVSQKQSMARALMSGWPGIWRNLSDSDKNAWQTWANLPAQVKVNSLGENYYVSGFNWMVTVNTWRGMMGLAVSNTPPVGAWPSIPTVTSVDFSLSGGSTVLDLAWANGEFSPGEAVTLYAVQFIGAGRLSQTSGYLHVGTVTDPGAVGESFGSALEALFGIPTVGDQVFIRVFKNSTEGLRSGAFQQNVICA